MKKLVLIPIVFFFLGHLLGQVIYISTTNNRIYRLDLETCKYVEIVQLNKAITDISFHPDGTLYSISSNGSLSVVDTITGIITTIHQFNSLQRFNSLTCSGNGILYTTGDLGELWSYDKSNNLAVNLGLIGFRATGDLTFYKGKLYAAAENDRIILVDINNPPNSSIAIDGNIPGEIFGIVSYAASCDSINCYAVSSGNSNIYEINFPSKTLQLVCSLNIRVGGGASTYEFYGSSPIIYDGVITVDPTCNHKDGSITIHSTGGIPPVTYSINGIDFQTSNTFDHLAGGHYQFIISDANGCSIIEDTILASANGPAINNLMMAPTTCGQPNGEITVSASGGNGPLTFSIDGSNFQASPLFNNLDTAEYFITVQDSTGCAIVDSVLLTSLQPAMIDSVTTNAGCNGDKGFLIVNAHSGSTIHYSIDGSTFQDTSRFVQLDAGSYHITIKDDNGCTDTTTMTILTAIPVVIDGVNSVDSKCDGNDGSFQVLSSGGSGSISYSIDDTNFQNQNVFDHLGPGNYHITIKDKNGCRDTSSVLIHPGVALLIGQVDNVSPRCDIDDGSILITPDGGTGQVHYSIDGIHFQNSNSFPNLGPGVYTISIMDDAGCSANTSIVINSSPSIIVDHITTQSSDCGESTGMIVSNVTGGTGMITMSLDGGSFQTDNTFHDLAAGNHELLIVDENGCTVDTSVRVAQSRCKIYIPNTFSPNHDGINDVFSLFTSSDYNVLINKYMIFDRWGNMVYSDSDFPISSTEHWWDGTFKKMTMSPGVFAFYIEVTYDDGGNEIFKGSVTLIR